MASSSSTFNFLLILLLLTIFLNLILVSKSQVAIARAPFKPTYSLVLPLHKDNTTNLYVTHIHKRTPRVSVPLIVDLNGGFLWVTCDQNYLSSTYRAPFCHSTQCSRAGIHYCHKCHQGAARPGCHNNTCGVLTTNPLTRKYTVSELAEDVVSIQSLQGKWATIPHFLFACAPSSLLQGNNIPQNVQGIAGFGHTPVALPLQLASHFGFHPQFSVCLASSNNNGIGGLFFGNVPAKIQPRTMAYTPLTIGEQGEYHILVGSVRINNITVPFNTSNLFSRTRGFMGTMISTTSAYTVLQHSVFRTFTQFFAQQLVGVPQVQAVPPFGMCFNSNILPPTRVGTPNIDFVLQNRNVTWTFLGVDALVRVRQNQNVSCLAFVDGGVNARAPITIGLSQLENNFLHFDLSRSRLGFIPSRLSEQVNCSDFIN